MTDKEKLIRALAHVTARRSQVAVTKEQAKVRAREQLDTMPDAMSTIRNHLTADVGGGPLGQRVLRTMLTERERLAKLADG